jgi:hypothetical protein
MYLVSQLVSQNTRAGCQELSELSGASGMHFAAYYSSGDLQNFHPMKFVKGFD